MLVCTFAAPYATSMKPWIMNSNMALRARTPDCENNMTVDQPGHLRSLIRAIAIHYLESTVVNHVLCKIAIF